MVTLRPYQVRGNSFLASRNGVLAWEPGVGKTFAALAAGRAVGGPQLYLCPANLRLQVADAAKALDANRTVQVIADMEPPSYLWGDVVVASYNGAAGRKVSGKADVRLFNALFRRSWGSLVLDEAHALKERDARRTRAIYGARTDSAGALFRRARFTWALTGTPVLASPADLWTHYSRLFPFALLGDDGEPLPYAEWVDRFCVVRNEGFGDKIVGGKNLDELSAIIAPFVDVVRSADVLGLDAPTIDHVPLHADALLARGVPAHAEARVRACLPGFDEGSDDPLGALQEALATERRLIAVAKADAVADYALTELAGGRPKVVIFGHHVEALDRIHARLVAAGAWPTLYRGGMTPDAKDHAKTRFLKHPHCRAFVANITAAGIGTDGLQDVCQRMIFAEADWTPGINDQCIRRLWRSGQAGHVHASFLSLAGSIDEDVQRALARKAKIIAKIFKP